MRQYFLSTGLREPTARARATAIDAFVLSVSTRRRLLRCELDDPETLELWLSISIPRLAVA